MATAEINELFEEGVTRCGELTDAADETLKAIDTIAADAETLAKRVEAGGAEASRHLRDLSQRLQMAEADLESSRSQAEGVLAGLGGAAGELTAGIADLLARVQKSMGALEARKDELDQSLDVQMSATQEGFEGVVEKTGEAQQHAEQQLDQVAQALTGMRDAIDAARVDFAQKQQDWATAADEMGVAVQEQITTWVAGLNDLLSLQAQVLVDTTNATVDQHNESMEGLRHRFIEEAPQHLATLLEPIQDAVEQLGAEAGDRQDRLSSAAQAHEQRAGNALSVVDRIQDALDAASRLG